MNGYLTYYKLASFDISQERLDVCLFNGETDSAPTGINTHETVGDAVVQHRESSTCTAEAKNVQECHLVTKPTEYLPQQNPYGRTSESFRLNGFRLHPVNVSFSNAFDRFGSY